MVSSSRRRPVELHLTPAQSLSPAWGKPGVGLANEGSLTPRLSARDEGGDSFTVKARDMGELAKGGAGAVCNQDHVVSDARFLVGSISAQTHSGESGPDLVLAATSVFVPSPLSRRSRHRAL